MFTKHVIIFTQNQNASIFEIESFWGGKRVEKSKPVAYFDLCIFFKRVLIKLFSVARRNFFTPLSVYDVKK